MAAATSSVLATTQQVYIDTTSGLLEHKTEYNIQTGGKKSIKN